MMYWPGSLPGPMVMLAVIPPGQRTCGPRPLADPDRWMRSAASRPVAGLGIKARRRCGNSSLNHEFPRAVVGGCLANY